MKITTTIPVEVLQVYELYAARTGIRTIELLQSDTIDQAGTLVNDVFGGLEWMENNVKAMKELPVVEITMEFCESVHSLLYQVAHYLRWDLPELVTNLLICGSCTISGFLDGVEKGEWHHPDDLTRWAVDAIRFKQAAVRNEGPEPVKGITMWAYFNLKRVIVAS